MRPYSRLKYEEEVLLPPNLYLHKENQIVENGLTIIIVRASNTELLTTSNKEIDIQEVETPTLMLDDEMLQKKFNEAIQEYIDDFEIQDIIDINETDLDMIKDYSVFLNSLDKTKLIELLDNYKKNNIK